MTAAQLTHLAELAAYAAGFFATTDPTAAATFGDAALRADGLAAELRRDEQVSYQAAQPRRLPEQPGLAGSV
ncbi:MAG: hypothetical protein ACRDRL_32745 [Sciscionella sp.]